MVAGQPENAAMLGHLLTAAGILNSELDDHPNSLEMLRRANVAFLAQGDEIKANMVLNDLANELLFAGRREEAHRLLLRCVDNHRLWGTNELSYALDTLAQSHAMRGEVDEARACWLEAARPVIRDDQPMEGAMLLKGLAWCAAVRGRPETALRVHYCVDHILHELGGRYSEPSTRAKSRVFRGDGPSYRT